MDENINSNMATNDLLPIIDNNDTLDFDYKTSKASVIKVVGVGGGGSNAVKHMYEEGINDVSFLIINTDRQALINSPIPAKLQIGEGLGAGAHPEKARACAIESAEEIRASLNDGTQMVFITAGMGGGTGTGASPIVAQVAHEMGILTVAIVTIPFQFEGPRKINMALNGVDEISKYVDALLIVNNDRLCQIYPDLDFFNAFSKADDTLTIAARSISELVTKEGYINVDFADIETTLRDSGVAIISTGFGEGENRVTKAIEDAVNSPLLMGNDIHKARHLLFDLGFSKDNPVTMQEINELNTFVRQFEDEEIEVIWGTMVTDELGESVKMIILASGFEMNAREGAKTLNNKSASPTSNKGGYTKPTETKVTTTPKPVAQNASANTSSVNNEQQSVITPLNNMQQTPQPMQKKPSIQAEVQPQTTNTQPVGYSQVAASYQMVNQAPVSQTPSIAQPMTDAYSEPEPKPEPINAVNNGYTQQYSVNNGSATQQTEVATGSPAGNSQMTTPQQNGTSIQAENYQQQRAAQQQINAYQEPVTPAQQTMDATSQTVGSQPQVISQAQPKFEPVHTPDPEPATNVNDGIDRIRAYYGKEIADQFINQSARAAYYVFDDQDLDNNTIIEKLEALPAYNRRRADLSTLKEESTQDNSPKANPDGRIF